MRPSLLAGPFGLTVSPELLIRAAEYGNGLPEDQSLSPAGEDCATPLLDCSCDESCDKGIGRSCRSGDCSMRDCDGGEPTFAGTVISGSNLSLPLLLLVSLTTPWVDIGVAAPLSDVLLLRGLLLLAGTGQPEDDWGVSVSAHWLLPRKLPAHAMMDMQVSLIGCRAPSEEQCGQVYEVGPCSMLAQAGLP